MEGTSANTGEAVISGPGKVYCSWDATWRPPFSQKPPLKGNVIVGAHCMASGVEIHKTTTYMNRDFSMLFILIKLQRQLFCRNRRRLPVRPYVMVKRLDEIQCPDFLERTVSPKLEDIPLNVHEGMWFQRDGKTSHAKCVIG
jgi:hypothetical protein